MKDDTNGLVTHIIRHLTNKLEYGVLVHAFASREHPAAAASDLKLNTK